VIVYETDGVALVRIDAGVPIIRTFGGDFAPSVSLLATPPSNNSAVISTNLPPELAEVVKLSSAGLGDPVVLAYVNNSKAPYNVSADTILQLKSQGVSPQVIAAILSHDSALHGNDKSASPEYSQKLYAPTNRVQFGQSSIPVGPQTESQPGVATAPPQQQGVNPAPAVTASPGAPAAATIATQAPPPPQVEVITVAPGPDYYWAPGYWRWDGGWVWVRGGWNFRSGYGWRHRGWEHRGWDGHRR